MTILKRKNYPIIAIMLIAIILRLWNFLKFDLQSDPAINAFRSLGWLDYLGGGQSSPIIWFDYIPWWGRLSFHDGPPLTFAIQHVSFLIFGNNIIAALLPYLLANLGIIYIIYLLLKNLGREKAGLIAAGIFAISSYTTWMARTGYLEGIETFFITLSIYAFLKYLQQSKNGYLYFWASAVGLALLSKYTALFLIPAVFLYALLWQRKIFKNKHFWLSLIVILLLLTPIIVYNIMVFKTRGHFDASLSSMLGMRPADFSILTRSINTNFWGNWLSIINSLYRSISLPLAIGYLLLFLYSLTLTINKKNSLLNNFLTINILLIFAMFSFSGGEVRFLLIIMPFLIILTALYLDQGWSKLSATIKIKKIFTSLLLLVFAWELFFSLNTNILAKPLFDNRLTYSPDRFYNHGFNDLEKKLHQGMLNKLTARKKINQLADISKFTVSQQDIVLVDGQINWFSRLWYLMRYQFYYGQAVFYFSDVIYSNEAKIKDKSFISDLMSLGNNGERNFWFIFATDQGITPGSADEKYNEYMSHFRTQLEEFGLEPVYLIKDYRDQPVFKIYYLSTAQNTR